jgi:hypothetical protein
LSVPLRSLGSSYRLTGIDPMTDAIIVVFRFDRTCSTAVSGLACQMVAFKEFEGAFPSCVSSRAVMEAMRS